MSSGTTQMRQEINEIPFAVDRLLTDGATAITKTASAIRAHDPGFLISVARGSSDHACSYLKYAAELLLGLPMASVGPSVKSIYGVDMRSPGALCISVSQSGQSPDIVQPDAIPDRRRHLFRGDHKRYRVGTGQGRHISLAHPRGPRA